MNFETGRGQLTIPTIEDLTRNIMHWERLEQFKLGDLMVVHDRNFPHFRFIIQTRKFVQ